MIVCIHKIKPWKLWRLAFCENWNTWIFPATWRTCTCINDSHEAEATSLWPPHSHQQQPLHKEHQWWYWNNTATYTLSSTMPWRPLTIFVWEERHESVETCLSDLWDAAGHSPYSLDGGGCERLVRATDVCLHHIMKSTTQWMEVN